MKKGTKTHRLRRSPSISNGDKKLRFLCKIFRGAAPDPEDILLDLFGGEAASLRAVRRLLRGRLRLALALLTPTALRSIPPGLDWPKLCGSQG